MGFETGTERFSAGGARPYSLVFEEMPCFAGLGHGGSDGLNGYVPSLDHVVADTGTFLGKIKSENPGVPLFLFDHSTGGAVVLKVLHTFKAASYPYVQEMPEGIVLTSPALHVKPAHPIFAFKGANKRGIPVSRDPAAIHHSPFASRDLYNKAASEFKAIKLYDGFLHDLLFEPERQEIGQNIMGWMKKRLDANVARL
ncbi:putative Polyketide cyclase/dehydrase and lipid transport superfamily protein [Hibiscus syriacus]|uniref:Polyketide cyclase/dehydrase and lipid transport superfamily protein n=1 Tax=Hibiscus syriacus TaxID=106335 RepID=A0A6A2X1I2_HIBSY|nr:putative Polyketide cyclase/dehydrase and lipid transport superfamily protein [Hibiscus syriacus]